MSFNIFNSWIDVINRSTKENIDIANNNLIVIVNIFNNLISVPNEVSFLKNLLLSSVDNIDTAATRKPIPIDANVIVPRRTLSRLVISLGVI